MARQAQQLSAFTDRDLRWLMECAGEELLARRASAPRVQGMVHMIATHLARNYAEVAPQVASGSPSLPGFKLKQVTDWIEEHLADEFDLDRLASADRPGQFHFHRLSRRQPAWRLEIIEAALREAADEREHMRGQVAVLDQHAQAREERICELVRERTEVRQRTTWVIVSWEIFLRKRWAKASCRLKTYFRPESH